MNRPSRLLVILFETLLLATFAVWFGGFTFYVSIVVPLGTEILGSARSQGFITQQVTHWLNVVNGLAVALMLLELWWCGRSMNTWPRRIQWLNVVTIGAALMALVYLHPQLDNLISSADDRVLDRKAFYTLHRIYLWLSTLQWFAAWSWLLTYIASSRTAGRRMLLNNIEITSVKD